MFDRSDFKKHYKFIGFSCVQCGKLYLRRHGIGRDQKSSPICMTRLQYFFTLGQTESNKYFIILNRRIEMVKNPFGKTFYSIFTEIPVLNDDLKGVQ